MEIVRQKNVATRIVFPIVDADGDLVTGATGLDSEIDEFADGSNPTGFTDCTNEATEIGSTGIYYLNLTQSEMNQDYLVVQIKTSTSGAKTQVILIRTLVGDPLLLATTDDGGTINVAAGVVEAQVKSIDASAITATSIAADAITAAKIADGAIDAATFASGAINAAAIATDAITAAKIAADAIGASELAADAVTEIQSGLSTLTQANIRTAVGLGSANLDTQLSTIDDFLDTEIAAIKAKTDNLPTDPADASDIAASFTTVNSKLDAIDDYIDTEVAAIKAKTDNLPASPAAVGSAMTLTAAYDAAKTAATQSSVDAIDDYIDTEVAAIKAKTDNLPASPAATSDIPTAAAVADAVWEEAIDDHVGTAGSTAETLAIGASIGGDVADLFDLLSGLITEKSGVGSTGNDTTHIHLNRDGVYGDDDLNERLLVILDDSTSRYYSRWIEDYVGATSLVTVATLPFTPEDGVDIYFLLSMRRDVTGGGSAPTVQEIVDGILDENVTTHTNPDSVGEAIGNAGGGSSPSAIADTVWDEKIDDHLSDRSFGMKIGIHLPVVSPDIDYKRIKKVVNEEVQALPKPKDPEKVDMEPISVALQGLYEEIRAIKIPEPEKTDLEPILKQLEGIKQAISDIEIPETDLSETNSLIQDKNDVLDALAEAQDEIKSGQLERIKAFFESGVDKITKTIEGIAETLNNTQMVVLEEKPKKDKKEKPSVLDEYLNLP